jgi:hypothetical protein
LAELPRVGRIVRLAAAAESGSSLQRAGDVEFGPLGETTRSAWTLVWLAAGSGEYTRYVNLSVNPVTGLAAVGACSRMGPPAAVLP